MHRHGHFINALLGAAVVMTIAAFVFEPPSDKILRVVAFVGKSMQYVNDMICLDSCKRGLESQVCSEQQRPLTSIRTRVCMNLSNAQQVAVRECSLGWNVRFRHMHSP
jgi:hypothetical protein